MVPKLQRTLSFQSGCWFPQGDIYTRLSKGKKQMWWHEGWWDAERGTLATALINPLQGHNDAGAGANNQLRGGQLTWEQWRFTAHYYRVNQICQTDVSHWYWSCSHSSKHAMQDSHSWCFRSFLWPAPKDLPAREGYCRRMCSIYHYSALECCPRPNCYQNTNRTNNGVACTGANISFSLATIDLTGK